MKNLYIFFRKFARKLRQDDMSAHASSIAFFLFLSLIPILMLVCSVLPFTPLSEADLMILLRELTPDGLDPMIVGLVSQVYDKATGILSFALIMTVWSAGKGMLALMRALNVVNGVEEERGYFHLRALASVYTIIVLAGIIITLCIGVFGKQFLSVLLIKLPSVGRGMDFWGNFRFILVFLFASLVNTLIYTYIPAKKVKLRDEIAGGVLASFAWNLCSFAFSVYVEKFNTFSAYGSLGTIIVFLLWLYFYCYVLLVGANLNKYFLKIWKFN